MIQNKKRIISLILMLTLLVSALVVGAVTASAADNVSDFDTIGANTTYNTKTSTNGWVGTNCASVKVGDHMSLIMNGKTSAVGSITSPSLSDGVSSITFGYANAYSESNGVSVTITVTSSSGEQSTTLSKANTDVVKGKAYSHTWTLETPVTGDFTIKFTNNSPSKSASNKDRVSIFNVTWVSYTSGGTPEPEVPVVTYDYSFNVPAGFIAPAGGNGNNVTLPEFEGDLSNDYSNYTFEGWCVGDYTSGADIYKSGFEYELTEEAVFTAVFSCPGSETTSAYILKELNQIGSNDVVIIVHNTSSGYYAMSNNNGTSSAPSAVKVSVIDVVLGEIGAGGDLEDTIKWNISNSSGNLTIYPNGDAQNWLYCTSTNNGVRVGTNANKTFVIDDDFGYLKHTGTNRYVGVYNAQDWRCYTSTGTNISNQKLEFYVLSTVASKEYTSTLEKSECECEYVYASLGSDTHRVTCKNGCDYNVVESCSGGTATCTALASCEKCGQSYGNYDVAKHSSDKTYVKDVSEATCTTPGYTGDTYHSCCDAIKEKGEITYAKHDYVDNICSVCGKVDPLSFDYSGRYVIAVNRGNDTNYFYMTSDLGTASTKRYQAVDSGLKELTTTLCPEYEGVDIFVLVKNDEDGTYKIYAEGVEGDNYLGWSSGNSGILVAEAEAISFTVDLLEGGLYNIHFAASDAERYLSLNSASDSDYFAFYKGTQSQDLSLVPVSDGHIYNTVVTNPTFDKQGYTTYTCACGHSYKDDYVPALVAVATADGDKYTSLAEALENGSEIVLLADVNLEATIVITGSSSYTFDLNGHIITAGFSSEIVEAFLVKDGGRLVIFGNGQILANGDGEHVECISAIDGGMVTIENGTFISNGCTAIYATRGGSVTIKGGYYEAKELYNGMNFLIDINEAEVTKGVITISGGTFVDFNPANHNNDGKGYTNKVDEGYAVVQNGNEYTVKELNDVIGAPVDGTITLDKDITISGDLAIVPGTTLDINGKTITATGGIVTFGTNQIIDSGETKGLIKVAKGKLVFTEGGESTLVPVWNEKDGYFLANITDQFKSDVVESENDDSFSVTFRPSLDKNSDLNLSVFGNGAVGNGIKFIIKITGTNAQGTKDLFVGSVSDSIIAQAYDNNGAIRITIRGADLNEYTEFNVQLIITNDTSLTHTTTICSYTKDGNGDVCVK